MSSGAGNNSSGSASDEGSLPPVQSEILCFMREKCKVMTFDDIVKICTDFYREDEIMLAKSLLDRIVPHRLPKRQGENKCRVTVQDCDTTLVTRHDTTLKTCLCQYTMQ